MRGPLTPRSPLASAFVVMLAELAGACTNGAVAYCEERAKVACELAFACCDPGERNRALAVSGAPTTSPALTDTEGECVERATAGCRATHAATDDAVALGRIVFDDVRARECLAALEAAAEGCDLAATQRAQLACDDVTDGVVDGGGDCALSSECRAGGTCDLGGEPDIDAELRAPAGACIEPPAQGEECPEGVCATGLFCQNNRCDRRPGEGDPCNVECASGLFCNADFLCAALAIDGAACIAAAECLSGTCAFVPGDDSSARCGGAAPGQCGG